MDRPARAVFVRNGGAEQRHHAIASVLVDGALEAVHLRREEGEAVVHDLVHHFGIEVSGQGHEARRIGEEYRDLLAFPFQRAAGGENFFREIGRGVRERRLGRGPHGSGGDDGGGPRGVSPDQAVPRVVDHLGLRVEQFVLQGGELCVIQRELELKGAIGHTAPLAQESHRLIHHRDKVHPDVLPAWCSASMSMGDSIIA